MNHPTQQDWFYRAGIGVIQEKVSLSSIQASQPPKIVDRSWKPCVGVSGTS